MLPVERELDDAQALSVWGNFRHQHFRQRKPLGIANRTTSCPRSRTSSKARRSNSAGKTMELLYCHRRTNERFQFSLLRGVLEGHVALEALELDRRRPCRRRRRACALYLWAAREPRCLKVNLPQLGHTTRFLVPPSPSVASSPLPSLSSLAPAAELRTNIATSIETVPLVETTFTSSSSSGATMQQRSKQQLRQFSSTGEVVASIVAAWSHQWGKASTHVLCIPNCGHMRAYADCCNRSSLRWGRWRFLRH